MVSKFDDELILDRKAPDFTDVADQTGLRHGPCAMGNTADGHSLSCMHVLLLQDVGGRVATATGVSGRLTRKDRPKKQGRWMVKHTAREGVEAVRGRKAGPRHGDGNLQGRGRRDRDRALEPSCHDRLSRLTVWNKA